jgi:HEAT repeat protein
MANKKLWRTAGAIGGVALAAALASAYFVWEKSNAPRETNGVVARDDERTGRGASARGRNVLRDSTGATRGLGYDVDFQIAVDSGTEELAQHLAGTAKLNLYPVGSDPRGARWVGTIDEATGAVDGEIAATTSDEAVRELEVRFAFVVTPQGEVVAMGFPAEASRSGQSVARALVAALQFVRPEGGTDAWTTKEPTSLGRCNASYQRTTPQHYKKTKTECSLLSASGATDAGVKTSVQSSAEYDLGPQIVEKVSSSESLKLTFPQGGEITVSTKLELALSGEVSAKNPCPGSDAWKLGPLYAPTQEARSPSREEELAAKRALLAGARFSELSAEIEAAISAEDAEARTNAFSRLSALFELDPESIKEAAAALRTAIESSKAEGIVAALSDSRSPAAQSEMNSLIKDPKVENHVKEHVLAHMGLHGEPSLETIGTLEDVALHSDDPQMRDQAILALGGVAKHADGREETRNAAERTTNRINSAYDKAKTPEERSVILGAMGNAGAQSSLPAIETALKNDNPDVRADAVFSLRFIQGEHAERLIAGTLLGDPAPMVRRAAAETFGYRDLSPLLEQAALSAYKADTASFVRHSVISFLCAKVPNVGTSGIEALRLATRDEDEAVRTNATAALSLLAV